MENLGELTTEQWLEGQLLLVDKPLGWSSFQAVNTIKWALLKKLKLKKIKIGHAGTLDPLASGLLNYLRREVHQTDTHFSRSNKNLHRNHFNGEYHSFVRSRNRI